VTPEGKIKSQIKKILNEYGVYYFMPVQSGLGAAGVDFHCVVSWRGLALAFFIEAKEFGKELTARQRLFLEDREQYQNAKTFVVHSFLTLKYLVTWLEGLKQSERQSEDYSPVYIP
jgi:hypothetical protein